VVKKELLDQIYNDFSYVIEKKDILGILLFGSYSKSKNTNRSDIDICIVAPKEDLHKLLSFILQNINVVRMFHNQIIYS